MVYKKMWDWMDKAEGKTAGSSYRNLQKEMKRQGYGKGWVNEPTRHSLSAMGIKTGTKKSYIMNAKKGYFGEPKLSPTNEGKVNQNVYGGYEISDLKAIFDKYQNPMHWKEGVDAIFDDDVKGNEDAKKLAIAIRFYHGCEAKISKNTVNVYPHPDALVKVQKKVIFVNDKGYSCD